MKKKLLILTLLSLFPGLNLLYAGSVLAAVLCFLILAWMWYFQYWVFVNVSAPFDMISIFSLWSLIWILAWLRSLYLNFSLKELPKMWWNQPVILLLYYVLIFFVVLPWEQDYINNYHWKWFEIPSDSMQPSLLHGDMMLVDLQGIEKLKQGDIVVFKNPTDLNQFYVKRVVGLPGDRITFNENLVYVNGVFYPEPFRMPEDVNYNGNRYDVPALVNAKEYYVLGDYRSISKDSRLIGAIPENLMVGKLVKLAWSIDPETNNFRLARMGKVVF